MSDHTPLERPHSRRKILGAAAAAVPVAVLAGPGVARADERSASAVARAARPDQPECLADLTGGEAR